MDKPPITAIQALIIKDDKLLIVREKDYFLLPGGKPHNGETQIETLRRELKEETNLSLISVDYFGTYNYSRALTVDRPLTLICYIANVSGTPKASSEVDELVWINKHDYANSDKFPKSWWDPIFKDLKENKKINLI